MSDELKRIIYAEDEVDIQEIVKISLIELGGFELKVCSSGEELLQEYADYAPDLILLDVMMPVMDGVSTFTALKEMKEYNATPVIFMTAKVQVNEVQFYKDLGAIEVISKPFNPMTLPDLLRQIWQKRKV
ncbi:MAG: response regulator [Gammaproteobacteria bacterium]|nr:response regulator [Gammaproteobacteria bacterium]